MGNTAGSCKLNIALSQQYMQKLCGNWSWESRASVCWLIMLMLGIHVMQKHLCASEGYHEISVISRPCKKSTNQHSPPCMEHRGAIHAAATSFRAPILLCKRAGDFQGNCCLGYFCLLVHLTAQLGCKLKQVREPACFWEGSKLPTQLGQKLRAGREQKRQRCTCYWD